MWPMTFSRDLRDLILINERGVIVITRQGTICFSVNKPLEPIYTKHQSQCCNNSAMMLVILFSLKTMESLQNGVVTHFRVTPLFFNKNSIASVLAALSLTFGVNGPLVYLHRRRC